MTNEERDLISKFVQRVGGPPATTGGFAASVPAVSGPPLPPVDPEADGLIAELYAKYPEARYRMTQFAFVQEHAVAAASNQITQLQAQVQQLQQRLQGAPQQGSSSGSSPWGNQPPQQPAPQQSRGLFGSLFGSSQPAPQQQPQQQPQYQPQMAQPMAQPQYAPGYQPGMFQRQGSGFLGSALTTAAGVAGGMVAANALTGLFSGHHDSSNASLGGGGFGGQQNYPGEQAPWSGTPSGGGFDSGDQGGDAKSYPADQSGWNNAPAPDSGWQDASSAPADTGWQDASNNSSNDSGWSDSSSSGGGTDFDNT